MVGTSALFDTNILIDYLGGVPSSRVELERYENRAISVDPRVRIPYRI